MSALKVQTVSDATTVQIFLVDGDPDGLQIVTMDNWSGKALISSRAQFHQAKKRSEFMRPGVYLLIGPAEGADLPTAYIGEGDSTVDRFKAHDRDEDKDFWNMLIVFTSDDNKLNKAHIQHLESSLIKLAKEANRCVLHNDKLPSLPTLSESDDAMANRFLARMLFVFSVLGIKIFDVVRVADGSKKMSVVATAELRVHYGGQLLATGFDKPEGFVVTKGSKCRAHESESGWETDKIFRRLLEDRKVLKRDGEFLVFLQDYAFSSPSRAAKVVLGRSVNGRTEWKNSGGVTLKEIQEEA